MNVWKKAVMASLDVIQTLLTIYLQHKHLINLEHEEKEFSSLQGKKFILPKLDWLGAKLP